MADTPYPPQDRFRWARTFPGLTPTERCLLFILADYANSKTTKCWPGIDTLAKDMEAHKTHVQRYVKRLEEKGAIICIRKPGSWNNYFLRMEGVEHTLPVERSLPVDNTLPAHQLPHQETIRSGGGRAESTSPVEHTLPEQSINREKKKERTEKAKSFVSHSQHGDQDEGQDEAPADLERQKHALSDIMKNLSKGHALPNNTNGKAKTNGKAEPPVEEQGPSPFRRRLEQLMAGHHGLTYLEAVEQVEKEGL